MRILITGISGFVARHFVEYLSSLPQHFIIAGIYNRHIPEFSETQFPNLNCRFHKMDLLDNGKLKELVAEFNPRYILHLGSKSSVVYSWKHPAETIRQNTGIFTSIIESLRSLDLECRLLSIGSAEEYGIVSEDELPLVETFSPNPASPYGISRVMQQQLAEVYTKNYGLDIVHTRSFNHIGPYQSANFVLSSFAKQIVNQQRIGSKEIRIAVGNIEVTRDFTDVRDVVKAYYLLLINGKPGDIYNICSNKGVILKDLIKIFEKITGTKINCVLDPKTFHPSENKQVIGSFEKIHKETGWAPEIPIEKTLLDLLEYWKKKTSH
ncbi:MAG: GDP-mannose 4,6-dehydratase [Ferruginibacter sp.]